MKTLTILLSTALASSSISVPVATAEDQLSRWENAMTRWERAMTDWEQRQIQASLPSAPVHKDGWFTTFLKDLVPDARDLKTFGVTYGAVRLGNMPVRDDIAAHSHRILDGQTTILDAQGGLLSAQAVLSGQVAQGFGTLGQQITDAELNLSGQIDNVGDDVRAEWPSCGPQIVQTPFGPVTVPGRNPCK